jgi:hypothetical protein
VRIDEQAFARAGDLIAHDLTATLGWDADMARTQARDALGNRLGWVPTERAWDDLDHARQREVLDEVVVGAVDVQQYLHDSFVDTSLAAVPTPPEPSPVAWGRSGWWRRRLVLSSGRGGDRPAGDTARLGAPARPTSLKRTGPEGPGWDGWSLGGWVHKPHGTPRIDT